MGIGQKQSTILGWMTIYLPDILILTMIPGLSCSKILLKHWDINGGRNYLSLFIFMPFANSGRPLSVVRISAFTDLEATHAKQVYRDNGSSPNICKEGFAHPSARLRRCKTKLVLYIPEPSNVVPFLGLLQWPKKIGPTKNVWSHECVAVLLSKKA